MYNISKRKQFSTVGELKQLVADIGDDTVVSICGDGSAWIHVETDGSLICLDYDGLDDYYEEEM